MRKKVIECNLQSVVSKYFGNEDKKPRNGVYLQSMYWDIKGYGKKIWVVAVKIELDYKKAKEEYESDDVIVQKCIEFLNVPPKSKYGKRRKRKPLYTFEALPHSYTIVEKGDKIVISARLKTRERKNKYFWKSGPAA
tara:strand:+ start:680 stop:1090 length:411 start_codon:yes stop_codon:yes gene_type:complete